MGFYLIRPWRKWPRKRMLLWKTENIPEAIAHFTQARDTFSSLDNQMGYEHMSAVIKKLRGGQSHSHQIPDEGLNFHTSPTPPARKS